MQKVVVEGIVYDQNNEALGGIEIQLGELSTTFETDGYFCLRGKVHNKTAICLDLKDIQFIITT